MTGYERVKAALDHKEPDKIPFDLGGTMVSGINVKALAELKKYLGLESQAMVKDTITQMAETGEDMIDFLKVDVKSVGPLVPEQSKLKDLGHRDGSHFVEDEWGMQWRMPPGGHYTTYLKIRWHMLKPLPMWKNIPGPTLLIL
jgi:uroporphyrinogen decarboxylase